MTSERLDSIWWMAAPNLLTVRLSLDQVSSLLNADKNLTTNGGHSQSCRAMLVRSGCVACCQHLGHMPTNRHFRVEPSPFQSACSMSYFASGHRAICNRQIVFLDFNVAKLRKSIVGPAMTQNLQKFLKLERHVAVLPRNRCVGATET